MLPAEHAVLGFFIVILFAINGLHSYPQHQSSLGNLNEFIEQDSNSPVIVVEDFNNQARTLDEDRERRDRHVYYPGPYATKFSEREYENALYELLRANERMQKKQQARSFENGKIGKNRNNGKKEKKPLALPILVFFARQVAKQLAKEIAKTALDKVGEKYDVKGTTDAIGVALDILALIPVI